jgi:hypothetical protein
MTESGKMRPFELMRERMDDNRAEPARGRKAGELGSLGKKDF